MKMHITQDDLGQLTENQKRRLSELWKPEKYDLVTAFICKDADTEECDIFEFVVGRVTVDKHAHIYINDIKAPELDTNELDEIIDEEGSDSEQVENESEFEEDSTDEEQSEEDIDQYLIYSRPTCFNKEECFPLVNIGQMIDILQRNNYGDGDFYLTVGTAELGCELGKNTSNFNSYGFDHENKELCNALWELVKTVL